MVCLHTTSKTPFRSLIKPICTGDRLFAYALSSVIPVVIQEQNFLMEAFQMKFESENYKQKK
jgi:hypothetical protein